MPQKMGHKRQGSIDLLEVIGVVNEKGSQNHLPPEKTPLTYDYVLVANNCDNRNSAILRKQADFVDALKTKKLKIEKIDDNDKVFYGIKAPKEIFGMYRYLLKVSDACNWSYEQQGSMPLSTRIRIVNFILHHTCISETGEYLQDLIKKNVFEAEFCLHEKKEQKELQNSWARWTACFQGQPISNVRNYFGEKVALYYLWLGWYTFLLIPAALLGIVVFLYGLSYQNSPMIDEVCKSQTVMCPLCDKKCPVWNLSEICTYAKLNLLIDNELTVAFAMFMAVWATVFLEFWKRHRASFVCEWKVFDWSEEEEELILEIVNNPECEPKQYKHSYLRSMLVMALVTLMLVLIIGLTHALVVFRVIATVLLADCNWEFLSDHASLAALTMGAVLHYLTITIMTRVNRMVAIKLCDIERVRSHAGMERSFTVKMFTFQFFTLFSSLIYTAFFLGRINGHPGNYSRIQNRWRLEECHPGGCLIDLFIQMAVIMVLKQSINNVFEITGPWLSRWVKRHRMKWQKRKCKKCYLKECQETNKSGLCDNCKLQDLQRNYRLNKVDCFSLFNEFLEMVIQFSFTTIFVAAFPLAPLLALLNNIIEIRLDAIKMVSLERRIVPQKTNNIGVWTTLLEAVGVLAVIANGLVIGISSDFIPRLVYRYYYGPCYNASEPNCMKGYINNTLSTVWVLDPLVSKDFSPNQLKINDTYSVTHCSYRDYRSSEDYSLTPQYWLILAVRLVFVILFEHVVVIFKFIAAWFVPSSSLQVKNTRLQDKLKRLKEELSGETFY